MSTGGKNGRYNRRCPSPTPDPPPPYDAAPPPYSMPDTTTSNACETAIHPSDSTGVLHASSYNPAPRHSVSVFEDAEDWESVLKNIKNFVEKGISSETQAAEYVRTAEAMVKISKQINWTVQKWRDNKLAGNTRGDMEPVSREYTLSLGVSVSYANGRQAFTSGGFGHSLANYISAGESRTFIQSGSVRQTVDRDPTNRLSQRGSLE
ncbi:hypothetical protein N7539_008828 [Penicillium diatomitis]|uniref:Uncharacterized protein n=1 Tax=Penicillium diatomitis TaxID=2819901 RepID=A0A9W9WQM0_9EURO|nr:uncharacterized protein N7539_008828 [Penicillium diatomitis]KAJ5471885.1 hypothetical protein N7539_008828 [Penicillium diatomitis]